MKNLLRKTTLLGILVSGSLAAQSFIDVTETTKWTMVENDMGETAMVKTITKKQQPRIFEAEDQFKLNQDMAETPVYVDKTVLVDTDNDADYEKEAHYSYIKDEDEYYLMSEEIVTDYGDEMFEYEILFDEINITE